MVDECRCVFVSPCLVSQPCGVAFQRRAPQVAACHPATLDCLPADAVLEAQQVLPDQRAPAVCRGCPGAVGFPLNSDLCRACPSPFPVAHADAPSQQAGEPQPPRSPVGAVLGATGATSASRRSDPRRNRSHGAPNTDANLQCGVWCQAGSHAPGGCPRVGNPFPWSPATRVGLQQS